MRQFVAVALHVLTSAVTMNETRAAELGFRIERIVSTTYVHNLPIDHTSVLAVVCTLVDIIYIVASLVLTPAR